MIPTVSMLNPPEEFTSTAKVRIAPTTNKNKLKPMPTSYLLADAQGVRVGIGNSHDL
jgi:hypothetical protein